MSTEAFFAIDDASIVIVNYDDTHYREIFNEITGFTNVYSENIYTTYPQYE